MGYKIPEKIKPYKGLVSAWKARHPKPKKKKSERYLVIPLKKRTRNNPSRSKKTKKSKKSRSKTTKLRTYARKAKSGIAKLEGLIIPLVSALLPLQHAWELGLEATVDRIKHWRPYFNADDLFKKGHYDYTYYHCGNPIKYGLAMGIALPIISKIVGHFRIVPSQVKTLFRVGAKVGWGLAIGGLLNYAILIPATIPQSPSPSPRDEMHNPTSTQAKDISAYYG